MEEYIVKPLSSKKENLYLVLSVIGILLVAIMLLKMRVKPTYRQEIEGTQISAFEELNSIEQGIYSEILNALVEIDILKDGNNYPEVEVLESEEISPFFKDVAWSKKGDLQWSLEKHDDVPIYIGSSGDIDEAGSFVIEVDREDIDRSKIYYTKEALDTKLVARDFDQVKTTLKEIVAYTGSDERKKFKGE